MTDRTQTISSAHSDDGRVKKRAAGTINDEEEHRVPAATRTQSALEEGTGLSITANLELSPRARIERPDEDDAISEQPDESDQRSSPPGTIGDRQDIMSENIDSRFHQ